MYLADLPQVFTPIFHRPRVGRRTRVFLSVNDRDAYEAGWNSWPASPTTWVGPYADGWADADWEQEEKDDAKREAFERDNDWGRE